MISRSSISGLFLGVNVRFLHDVEEKKHTRHTKPTHFLTRMGCALPEIINNASGVHHLFGIQKMVIPFGAMPSTSRVGKPVYCKKVKWIQTASIFLPSTPMNKQRSLDMPGPPPQTIHPTLKDPKPTPWKTIPWNLKTPGW